MGLGAAYNLMNFATLENGLFRRVYSHLASSSHAWDAP